jgi:hypothetical protein
MTSALIATDAGGVTSGLPAIQTQSREPVASAAKRRPLLRAANLRLTADMGFSFAGFFSLGSL